MRKLLEALFRYKWLIILPPILIPLLVTPLAIYSTPVFYESVAGVWVDHPAYLDIKGSNPYGSAALTESGQITELLHTRAFMLDVVKRTSLASLLTAKSGEARAQDLLDKGVSVLPVGTHLVTIRSRFSTPQVAFQVAQAVLDAYTDRSANQQLDQSGVAIAFFQSQVQTAQDNLAKASQDLSQYAIAMGYASSGDGTPLAPDSQSASSMDPKFADLAGTAKFAQQQMDLARASLQNAEQSSAAAVQGAGVGFQVIDPPQVPTAPTTQIKNIIVYIAAALVLSLGLSATLLVILVASDRSVRRDADLNPPVRVLGVIPTLKLKQRVPKGIRGTATRRAIGFVAGTALPAPKGSR